MNDRDAWDLLDDFLRQLQEREEVGRQMRLVLEMVHQATHADFAFLCTEGNGPVEMVGVPQQLPEWCRTILRTLLRQTPGVEG